MPLHAGGSAANVNQSAWSLFASFTALVTQPRSPIKADSGHESTCPTRTDRLSGMVVDARSFQGPSGRENTMQDFTCFTRISRPKQIRIVTRAHVNDRRDALARRTLSATTIRYRLY